MIKYKVKKVYPENLVDLEDLLNDGWEIQRADALHIASGTGGTKEGNIVYVLKKHFHNKA